MKKYIFRFNSTTNSGYIENEKTGSEAGIFYSQVEGLDLIDDMVENNAIEVKNALELIHDIIKSEMVLFTKDNEFDPLKFNLLITTYMLSIRDKIQNNLVSDKSTDSDEVNLCLCKDCGLHGYIYYNGQKSEEIASKDEALEIVETIYFEEIINIIEKEKLIDEIESSKLPSMNPYSIARLN